MATKVVTSVAVTAGEVTGGTSVTATADGQVCVRRTGAVTFDTLTVGDVSGAGGGSVTSVALAVPAALGTVSGSPVTSSGTLTFSLSTQTANTVFAGPTTGAAAAPTFRALVAADIPSLDAAKIATGTLPEARGGTNQSTYTLGDVLYASAANTLSKLAGNTTTTQKFLAQTGSGAASAAPGWVALAAADIPSLDTSKLTTGTLGVTRGGTGLATFAAGDVLYASASNTLAALAANATATRKFLRQVSGGAPAWDQPAASDVTGGAALTKVDDTNVTLTLGGTPTTALLVAASITAGWTGTLAVSRGGTGLAAVGAADTVPVSDGSALSYQYPALQLFAHRALGSYSRAGECWYGPSTLKALTPGAAVAALANKLYAERFDVPAGQTIYAVGVKMAAFHVGSANGYRVGIAKAADNGDPWPESIVWSSAEQGVSGGSLTNINGLVANYACAKGGLYWLLFATNDTTATYESVSPSDVFPTFGCANTGGASRGGIVRVDFTYGALPSYLPTAGRTILGDGDGAVPKLFALFKQTTYLLYDTFSDVDAVALGSHAMNFGQGWTAAAGTWEINSGKARQTDTTGGVKVVTADGAADCTIEADITTNASTDFTGGVAFRFSDTSNWWRWFLSSGTGNWRLIEHTASAGGTVRATYAVAPAANTTYRAKVVLSGNNINCYVDGTLAATFSSSAQASNVKHGLYESRSAGVNGNTWDRLAVTP